LRILSRQRLLAGKVVATVRHSLCSLCERCIEACPYGARALDLDHENVLVNPAMCQGCGSCAAVCPNSASVLEGFPEQQMFEVIDAAIGWKMFNLSKYIRRRLASKLILTVGLTLLVTISTWAYFNTNYQEKKLMENIVAGVDRLTNTIKLGTHYAMMLNSQADINQIINNIGRQKEIASIRIYNKEGEIKYSNRPSEIDTTTNIKNEACYICHRTEPPLSALRLEERTRIFNSP
jgi:ferredoxin